jgi:hypothetical protein
LLSWYTTWKPEALYRLNTTVLGCNPRLFRSSLDGGGDTGDLGESSTHPKSSERLINLGLLTFFGMVKDRCGIEVRKGRGSPGDGGSAQQGDVVESNPEQALVHEKAEGRAMEVYKGVAAGYAKVPKDDDDGMLEFDVEEEDIAMTSKLMAIAIFFSQKSFNPHTYSQIC